MKIKVIREFVQTVEQTWEVPDNADLDTFLPFGLPEEAEFISENEVLGDNYYSEIYEIRRLDD